MSCIWCFDRGESHLGLYRPISALSPTRTCAAASNPLKAITAPLLHRIPLSSLSPGKSPVHQVYPIYTECARNVTAPNKLWSKIFSSHAFVNDMFLKWVPWTGDKCTKTSLWLWSPTQKYTFSQFGFRGSVGRIERVRSKLPNGKQRFEVKVDTHKHTSTRAHGLWTQDTRPHHVLCGVKQSVTQCTIWDCQLAVMLCHN